MREQVSKDPRVLPAVLVVDDKEIQRRRVARSLTRAGWHVVEAGDGREAVAAAKAGGLALVLIEVELPDIDGFATTAAIRALDGARGQVPILALTATPVGDGGRRFRDAAIDGYVVRPGKPRALADAVEAWRPSAAPLPARRLGALLGEAELSSLLERFRASVAEALARLDEPDERGALAHRLAGLAGTLGFEEICATWLALSEGHGSALERARLAARKGLVELDRDLGSHGRHPAPRDIRPQGTRPGRPVRIAEAR